MLENQLDAWMRAHAVAVQTGLFFVLFGLFLLVEVLAPRRRPARNTRRWLVNVALTTLNVVVLSLLPVTFFGVAVWAQGRGYGLLALVPLPLAATVVVNLLLRGFVSFFTHFLAHRVAWLWRVHRVHHLDTELDVSSTVRFHPLEFVVNLAVGVPMVVAFGLSPWLLLAYEILDAGVTLFSHANMRVPEGIDRWLRYVIVTPDLHRVHHSSHQPETDSNFGAVFPIWDVVFGTFRTETREPHESMELGLEEVRDERVDRFGWLLASPFRRFDRGPS